MSMIPDPSNAGAAPVGLSLAERRQAFGAQLRELREEHGLSLDALAQTTRISLVFLQALEAGALEQLPGLVFARGFVRSIMKTLGCPEAEMLAAFDSLVAKDTPASVLKVEIKNKPVRQRSERVAKFLHNSQSLLRRGVLIQVAMPAAVVVVAVYWFATSAVLHRMAGHLRDHANALVVTPAKPLQLREVGAEAPHAEAVDPAKAALSAAAFSAGDGTLAPPTGESSVDAATTAAAEAAELDKAASTGSQSAAADSAQAAPTVEQEPSQTQSPGQSQSQSQGQGQAQAAAPRRPTAAHPSEAAAAPEAKSHAEPATASVAIPASTEQQVLELTVLAPVRIRLDVDKGKAVVKELAPDTYRFTFHQQADMMIYDAAAVKITFNGKQLGSLGNKGRVRRLSFQAQVPSPKKM